jgi:hypothetical protein
MTPAEGKNMNTNHSPTPWRLYKCLAGEYQEIFGPHGPHHDDRLPIIGRADAAFIVRACNCHEELLKVIQLYHRLIFGPIATPSSRLDATPTVDRI